MRDIDKAKEVLNSGEHTCVLCKGESLLTSSRPGIAPMMGFIASRQELAGYSAADRIVGRAAALLFALTGITEVYAVVLSDSGAAALDTHGIKYSFERRVPYISNRTGDGVCPMEQTVASISDPHEAYAALAAKIKELSGTPRT